MKLFIKKYGLYLVIFVVAIVYIFSNLFQGFQEIDDIMATQTRLITTCEQLPVDAPESAYVACQEVLENKEEYIQNIEENKNFF